jgi:hypothetical protein
VIRHLTIWLIVGVAGGALACGCGSTSTSTSTETVAGTSAPAGAGTSTSGSSAAGEHASATKPPSQSTKTPAETTTTPPVTASTGTWNTVQCNTALIDWDRGHRGSSAKDARSYKVALSSQHRCFTSKSRAPVQQSSANTWNTVQCSTALTSWYKGHERAGTAQTRSYRATLTAQHGCFTARSLGP